MKLNIYEIAGKIIGKRSNDVSLKEAMSFSDFTSTLETAPEGYDEKGEQLFLVTKEQLDAEKVKRNGRK